MEVKKVIFYFLWILGLLLMFMDFMLIGLALFLFTPFIFSPGKMKKNIKWEQFNKNKTVKVIKTTIAVIIFLSIVVLFFVNPKLNLIIPLFFIAVMFTPPKNEVITPTQITMTFPNKRKGRETICVRTKWSQTVPIVH